MLGEFQCLDREGNLILGNAYEIFPSATGKNEERHLGMVLIPLAQQKEVQLQVGDMSRVLTHLMIGTVQI